MTSTANAFRGTFRRFARVALGLAIFGMATFPGAAGADDGLLIYAGLSGSAIYGQALDSGELSSQRGQGLETQPPSAPGTSDEVAVILWDEYLPLVDSSSGSVSHSGNGGLTTSASSGY